MGENTLVRRISRGILLGMFLFQMGLANYIGYYSAFMYESGMHESLVEYFHVVFMSLMMIILSGKDFALYWKEKWVLILFVGPLFFAGYFLFSTFLADFEEISRISRALLIVSPVFYLWGILRLTPPDEEELEWRKK